MTADEKTELKSLLLVETGNGQDEGLLVTFSRQHVDDLAQRRLARVRELLAKLV